MKLVIKLLMVRVYVVENSKERIYDHFQVPNMKLIGGGQFFSCKMSQPSPVLN